MGKKAITSGPVIDKPADLAGLLTGLSEGDIYLSTRFTASPKWKNTLLGDGRLSDRHHD